MVMVCVMSTAIKCTYDKADKYVIKKVGLDVFDFIELEKDKLLKFDINRTNEFCLLVFYFEMKYVETDNELYCPIEGCGGRKDSIIELKWKHENFNYTEFNINGICNDDCGDINSFLNTNYNGFVTDDSIYKLRLNVIKDIYNLNNPELGINLFKGAHFDHQRVSFFSLISKLELMKYNEKNGMPDVMVETYLPLEKNKK